MRLSTGLGVILGLAAASYIDYWKNAFPNSELYGYSLLFAAGILAGLIGVYSIHRLTRVKETGEVEEEIIVDELISQVRRDMRNLSTVGGLRQIVSFPVSVFTSSR